MFFVVFLDTHFAHNLLFRGPFGVQVVVLFRVPGTLGNRLRTLKGIRFSHFGAPFWRDEFKARSARCFFVDFYDFYICWDPFRGLFSDENAKKGDVKKGSKRWSIFFMRLIPGNPAPGPCGPLKETKDQQILRDFAPRGSLKAVPGKATQFSH